MIRNKFSLEEINFIINNVDSMFYSDIAKLLNRSKGSIKNVVKRLNLSTPSIKKRLRDRNGKAYRDITGKRFGKLIVEKYISTEKKRNKKRALWLCKCDCGNKIEANTDELTGDHVKSCGCLKSDNQYQSIENAAYRQHIFNAKSREIENFLSKEQYLEIVKKPCTYCGDFSIRTNEYTGATLFLNSVDRIDNEKQYSIETVQSVCFVCQNMKHVKKHDDFLKHLCKISVFLNLK